MSHRRRAHTMRERTRGGRPSELRREYRHITLPHGFRRAPRPLQANVAPPMRREISRRAAPYG